MFIRGLKTKNDSAITAEEAEELVEGQPDHFGGVSRPVILALVYFAAREGYLGKKIKEITVYKVEKEKPPEKPPEKKAEPPKETPKPVEPPKVVDAPKPQAAPPVEAPPVVAPPAVDVPSFEFSDGAKAVNSESDPVQLYKGYLEYALRSKWNRPDNLPDDNYVAEVAVNVDKQGN